MNKFHFLLSIVFAFVSPSSIYAQRYHKEYTVPALYPTVYHTEETTDQYIFQAATNSNTSVYDLATDKFGNNPQISELPHNLDNQFFIRGNDDHILAFYAKNDSVTTFRRYTPGGILLWEKQIGLPGNPACNMYYGYLLNGIEIDGGYLILGNLHEDWVGNAASDSSFCVATKIDYSGNIISQNKNEGYYGGILYSRQIGDKYFFLHSPNAVDPSAELTWLDTAGNWAPIPYGYHDSLGILEGFDKNVTGALGMVGYTYIDGEGQEPFGRGFAYDANFQLLWKKAGWPELDFIAASRKSTAYIPMRIVGENNGWVMAGIFQGPNPAIFIARLDSSGNITVLRSFAAKSNFAFFISDLIATSDGGYLIAFLDSGKLNVIKTDANLLASPNQISGTLAQDPNLNCQTDTLESVLPGWIVGLANPQDTIYTFAYLDGSYELPADTGTYLLAVQPYNPYWEPCENDIPLYYPTENIFDTIDFHLQPAVECPQMEVDIALPFARRCFDNQLFINYCNNGTVAADSARLEVILDPLMSYVSSQVPVSAIHGDTLIFDLGTVAVLDCEQFNITVHIDCDSSQLGQTVCVSAHIYPDSFCLPIPAWSGGQLAVGGFCEQDSVVFWAQNVGAAATQQLDYVIIEDMVVWKEDFFNPLLPGESDTIRVAADGSTYGLLAEQEPGYPYNAFSPLANGPSAWVEACNWSGGGLFPGGFITQFPNEDGNPTTATDCNVLVGSYDPNDKTASPEGVGDKHFILPGTPLEYLIRFQNTGTDTAFRVVIRDQLPPQLDPLSLQILSGSHAYKTDFEPDNVLKFTFDQILLPDSNTNEVASHGFIKFRIRPRPDVPIGTLVENTAAIFFDFNDPVYTNTCFHTIDTLFIKKETDGVWEGGTSGRIANRIVPNPAGNQGFIQLVGREDFAGMATVVDISGRPIVQLRALHGKVQLPVRLLPGAYFLKTEDGWVAKFVVL